MSNRPALIEAECYRGILIFKEIGFDNYFIGRNDDFGLGAMDIQEAHTIIDRMWEEM